jgi:ABC-type transport system involved in multi-copper enzyme maturation permease subunit
LNLLNIKAVHIAEKNLKDKIRHWQYLFFSLGFPIIFTLIFYFIYGQEEGALGLTYFDFGFPGMMIYAIGVGTMNAAIYFADERNSGMLTRLDTMPTKRSNIFLGALISESIFLTLQIVIMFVVGYGILGVYFKGPVELLFGFLVAILFGISAVGLGIIIASISKTVQIANAFSLVVFMLLIFLSGSLMPFEGPIVYFTPPFWAKQIYLQLTVLGNGLNDNLYSSSLVGAGAESIPITLWGGILIVLSYSIAFIILGILIFQKKTKF